MSSIGVMQPIFTQIAIRKFQDAKAFSTHLRVFEPCWIIWDIALGLPWGITFWLERHLSISAEVEITRDRLKMWWMGRNSEKEARLLTLPKTLPQQAYHSLSHRYRCVEDVGEIHLLELYRFPVMVQGLPSTQDIPSLQPRFYLSNPKKKHTQLAPSSYISEAPSPA